MNSKISSISRNYRSNSSDGYKNNNKNNGSDTSRNDKSTSRNRLMNSKFVASVGIIGIMVVMAIIVLTLVLRFKAVTLIVVEEVVVAAVK